MEKISQTKSTASIAESVGVVQTQIAKIELSDGGFQFECGARIPELQVAYETYGTLSEGRDNAVFICHALTGDAHVAGYHEDVGKDPGWWEKMVGPGKGIDTDYYYVICANILGGCKGTTGPSSVNPVTKKPYGSLFPKMTVSDIVDVHRLLVRHLGIEKLAAIIGGSLGGMQVIDWTVRYPLMVKRAICIASATCVSAQALAFDMVGCDAITSDPDWKNGNYYDEGRGPVRGLAQARKIAHITYLSPAMMMRKFGRERRDDSENKTQSGGLGEWSSSQLFQVASYLKHQGEKLVNRFDANSYLRITQAMDEFDVKERYGSVEKAFEAIQAKCLIVALSADWLFPPEQSVAVAKALVHCGKNVSYCKLFAPHGHDAFLVDIENLSEVISAFLPWVQLDTADKLYDEPTEKTGVVPASPVSPQRAREFGVIRDMVQPGMRVLDIGCGDGELLSMLKAEKGVPGLGVDIDLGCVIDVIDKGHDILQGDIDEGLAMVPANKYDYAILSETLQVVHKPIHVFREMLRVAEKGIVSFPNFGNWLNRLRLLITGRMPKGGVLPYEWYDTPNIHLFTLTDFFNLCNQHHLEILKITYLYSGWFNRLLVRMGFCNLGAENVIAKIAPRG
jgi:homoserine O-acetyltransferase